MHVTVLGITGGVGDAVAKAFLDAGHTVSALARSPEKVRPREGLRVHAGDARDPAALDAVMEGADVVLHGLNLPYPDWDPHMLELTDTVLAAAERAGATLLFPGNVYGLGGDFSAPLDEDAPRTSASKKGALRNRMEAALAASRAQTVVLRAGDFFGGIGESSWMHHLTGSARAGGAIQYPASMETLHCWAFLPDVARTFVLLAERRKSLPEHSRWHFEGHAIDGTTWVSAVRTALGDPNRRVRGFPWWLMWLGSPFVPMFRELGEMRYLWDEPVRLDGSRLRALLGEVPHTPLDNALAQSLRRFETVVVDVELEQPCDRQRALGTG